MTGLQSEAPVGCEANTAAPVAGRALDRAGRLLSPERAVRLWRLLPTIYLVVAAVAGSVFFVSQPPGQTPDAYSHFYRAGEVATGQLFGRRLSSTEAGGYVPSHMQVLENRLLPVTVDPRARIKWHTLAAIARTPMASPPSVVSNSNTAIYPPLFYVPQALGIDLALLTGSSVLFAYEAAVVLNGIAAVALSYLALRFSRAGRFWLFTVLCLPMTLAEYFSISQDALLISTSALAFGIVSGATRPAEREVPAGRTRPALSRYRWSILGSYAILTAVNLSRPVYLSLLLLPLAIPAPCTDGEQGGGRRRLGRFFKCRWLALAALGLSLAAIGTWTVLDGLFVYSVQPRPGVRPQAQLSLVLQHPLRDLAIASHTLAANGVYYLHSFEGLLAWASLTLPRWIYALLTVALVVALIVGDPLEPTFRRGWVPAVGRSVGAAAVVALGLASVEGAELLTWTPLGDIVVQGVQGRYFLPLAPYLALVLPYRPRLVRALQPAALALVPILMIPPVLASGAALIRSFYIGA
ncbi:MAG: DUF2142 domain-containing protein [Actinomycetota bacterium]|nr:DUF2142 domain-containing protein [Actinomycetota bacterium]